VAEDFVDTTTPLKQLADAAMAPFGEHISQVSVKVTSEWRVTDTQLPVVVFFPCVSGLSLALIDWH